MKTSSYDVAVAGGGQAGVAAAIAAGRMGLRTLLIESQDRLGGMATSALVNNFCNAHHDGTRYIIGGIFAEIRDALIARDALYVTYGLEPYNHHVFTEVINGLCRDAGVVVRTGATITGCRFEENAPATLSLDGETISARVVVDASGDAVVSARAGVPFWPREAGGRAPMPLTYCYVLGPVDREIVRERLPEVMQPDHHSGRDYMYFGGQDSLRRMIREAREAGDLTIPRERIAVAYSIPGMPENIAVNFGRVSVDDPTDPEQLARAEKIGLAQVEEGARFFRKYVPGFGQSSVRELARRIGVRESRQIRGRYRLTRDDVLEGRQFDDAIAQCSYAIDIHESNTDKTVMIPIPKGTHYDIPLRCLIPAEGPANLIVAGRCISATQEAMSSFRVAPSVMAIGEAAGVAASLAAQADGNVALVDPGAVRARLIATGGILD